MYLKSIPFDVPSSIKRNIDKLAPNKESGKSLLDSQSIFNTLIT